MSEETKAASKSDMRRLHKATVDYLIKAMEGKLGEDEHRDPRDVANSIKLLKDNDTHALEEATEVVKQRKLAAVRSLPFLEPHERAQ